MLRKNGLYDELVETCLPRRGAGGFVREPSERDEALRATLGARTQPTSHLATVKVGEMKIDEANLPLAGVGALERLMDVGRL